MRRYGSKGKERSLADHLWRVGREEGGTCVYLWRNGDTLIDGAVVRKLRVNRDARGVLVETLRADWENLYDAECLPFAQTYYSVTNPWVARDEDRWHVHQHQEDRFVVATGNVVLAMHDWRPGSRTQFCLNLIWMGEGRGDDGQATVLVPRNVLHGFLVVGDRPAVLLNSPTRVYDSRDEGRVPFREVRVSLPDGRGFAWDLVRQEAAEWLRGSAGGRNTWLYRDGG